MVSQVAKVGHCERLGAVPSTADFSTANFASSVPLIAAS